MKDQAHTLRRIFEEGPSRTPEVLSVTSGKGAWGGEYRGEHGHPARIQGKKVIVLDADLGLANVDVMLGIAPS